MPKPKLAHFPRLLVFLVALTCLAQQSSNLATLPDITGTGVAVALTPGVHTYARWIQFYCPTANTSNVYWGDSLVSATRGSACPAGFGQMAPPSELSYDLSTVYVFVASGDKVKVTYRTEVKISN